MDIAKAVGKIVRCAMVQNTHMDNGQKILCHSYANVQSFARLELYISFMAKSDQYIHIIIYYYR